MEVTRPDTAVDLGEVKGSVGHSYIWEIVSETRSSLGKRKDRVWRARNKKAARDTHRDRVCEPNKAESNSVGRSQSKRRQISNVL